MIYRRAFWKLFGYSFRQQPTQTCHREKKKEKYTINVFLSLCYWVLTFLNYMCMATLLKESKDDDVSFVMFFFFFSNYLKSVVITSVWRMPNKHCNMYHKCISVFWKGIHMFKLLIYLNHVLRFCYIFIHDIISV